MRRSCHYILPGIKHCCKAIAEPIDNKTIIAADTIVVLNNEIIGKPKDREDAIAILKKLSGQKHKVITGVVILYCRKEIAFADTTEVEFHAFTEEQIDILCR